MKLSQSLVFSFLVCFLLITTPLFAQVEFEKHTIRNNFYTAKAVFAIDLDGDGDVEVLWPAGGRYEIAWFENDGNQEFTLHTIYPWFDGANDIYAIDLDSDDDIDILAAGNVTDNIIWFENNGDQDFTGHTISDRFDGAASVYAIDLDGDDDIDVLGAVVRNDCFAWFENDGDQEFTEHIIYNIDRPRSVYAIDLDSDGDIDVIGASSDTDNITWCENDGNQNFTEHTIDDNFDYAFDIYATDLDSDGDVDVLGAGSGEDEITWWENNGNENFTEHTITDNVDGACSVYAIDLDYDGDVDVLGAAGNADEIIYWLNDGEENFTEYLIEEFFYNARSVYATDLDGDGDIDVLGASGTINNGVNWWENLTIAPQPPDSFNLVEPSVQDTVWTSEVNLLWNTTHDPDSNSIPHYDVWFGAESDLSDAELIADSIADTSCFVENIEDDEIYCWTVRATDNNTEGTWAEDTLAFNTYFPEAPDSFNLISPQDGFEMINRRDFPLVFRWRSATDPDPNDQLYYAFELSTDNEFNDHVYAREAENSVSIDSIEIASYWWRVRAFDRFGLSTFSTEVRSLLITLSVQDAHLLNLPTEYSIVSAFPNPFNPKLNITFGLPQSSELKIIAYNITGREVAIITNDHYSPGYKQFTFDASELPSGIYFINATVPDKINVVRKVALIR
ncbi:MAG: T9SS type A sorting domain-containing protein [Candidatus Electryonea clarkiae]|nr:T9SS type A sorting domain-containing protein [Candidatus Electryonea clarkiae]MDP8286012.1 T9SS type A sorting domain-containing protein [Candidatus Electryonea clarkiae]